MTTDERPGFDVPGGNVEPRLRQVADVLTALRDIPAGAQAAPHEPESGASDAEPPWAGRRNRSDRCTPVGATLLERGLIDAADLDRALELQRSTGRRVGDTLVEMGVLSSVDLAEALAEHFGMPFVDLEHCAPDLALDRHDSGGVRAPVSRACG